MASRAERLQELKAAIELRRREVADLEEQRSNLYADINADGVCPGSNNATPHECAVNELAEQTPPTLWECSDLPVTAFLRSICARKRPLNSVMCEIPPEQAGNVMMQLETLCHLATLKVNHTKKLADAVAIREGKLHEEVGAVADRIRWYAELTGIPVPAAAAAAASLGSSGAVRTAKSSRRTSSASRTPCAAFSSSASGDADKDKQNIQSIKKLMIVLAKELHAANVVRQKNAKTVLQLSADVDGVEALRGAVGELSNRIRCLERDIAERTAALQERLFQHESLDRDIARAMQAGTSEARLILDRDVAALKQRVDDCAEGELRVQERVVKAQEYRIVQLEKRLATVKRALKNHRLSGVVDAIMVKALDDKSGGKTTPNGDARLGLAVTPSLVLHDTVPSSGGYDIDSVVPPQETIHPAIYSLLAEEKDALAAKVAAQNKAIREKDDEADALAERVAQLTLVHDEAQCLLSMTAAQVTLAEEQQRDDAVADVMNQRQVYKSLLQEKIELRRDGHSSWQAAQVGSRGSSTTATTASRSGISSKATSRSGSSPQPAAGMNGGSDDHAAPTRSADSRAVRHVSVDDITKRLSKGGSRVRFADDGVADGAGNLNRGESPDIRMDTAESAQAS